VGDFVEGSFLSASLPVMLGLMTAVALRLRDERRRAEQAQLTASRLEVELLKKNLQPHFLMNTLTALTEVIEQNPGAASTLIDDLATELRTLSRMSGDKRVTLAEEIELCRVHLRVMSVRTGVAWSLVADEVDENAVVPPAIFLTLIENAFVHQRPAAKEVAFRLRMERRADEVRYFFVSPGEVKPLETVRVSGGTGLRYVKARLEESFSGRWTFEHHASADGWETVITVRAAADGDLRA
jgi:LytS/YehU family sensor histidine kinase